VLDLRGEVVTWQQTFSSDVLKENISHAGGANECTVTSLLALFSFGTKRYIKIVAATQDLSTAR